MTNDLTKPLSRRQERAIVSLLAEPTIAAAAHDAGVSERAIYKWLRQDNFQSCLRKERRYALDMATARLQQLSCRAVETLSVVMDSAEASATGRVSAARIALDIAYRAVELEDMEDRVTALEDLYEEHRATS